jgi:hypothetical protein
MLLHTATAVVCIVLLTTLTREPAVTETSEPDEGDREMRS